MTAVEAIQQIEAAGGVLALQGGRVAYDVPRESRALVDVLRQHRNEVLRLLQEREETDRRVVSRWLSVRCAVPKNPKLAWASEKFLYRDYVSWCLLSGQVPIVAGLFAGNLAKFFQRTEDGWQGLCLAADRAQASE